jgi:hypothetical protein
MTSSNDTPDHRLVFAAFIIKRILENPLPGETPTSRIKQIGMINLIYQMQVTNIDTKVTNIMKLSQLSRIAVMESATPLVRRDLLREEQVLNSSGRGRALKFVIPEHIMGPAPFLKA